MTKTFFRHLWTCVAAAFVCIGMLVPADQAEAADYWAYTDDYGTQYYVSSTKTDWRFRTDIHKAYVTAVSTNQHKTTGIYSYGYDEGQWWYSENNSGTRAVAGHPVAQAVLNFCEAHWGRYGFHE